MGGVTTLREALEIAEEGEKNALEGSPQKRRFATLAAFLRELEGAEPVAWTGNQGLAHIAVHAEDRVCLVSGYSHNHFVNPLIKKPE